MTDDLIERLEAVLSRAEHVESRSAEVLVGDLRLAIARLRDQAREAGSGQATGEAACKGPRPVICESCGWVGERRQNRRTCPRCRGSRVIWSAPPAQEPKDEE